MPTPDKGYEFIEHTADIGIRAHGRTLAELVVRLAQGLTELIAEDSTLAPRQTRPIQLTAPSAEALLLVWLQELLFWFSAERFLGAQYALEQVTETSLRGEVRGDTFDPARHHGGTEVKGITRHQFSVEHTPTHWQARIIFDV